MEEQDALRELAEQKEKEWRLIQEKRIEALECSVQLKSQELANQKQKMAQLREDFKYNLKLLEERDGELEKYEESLLAIRKQLADKTSEISELKIKLDELRKLGENEKNAVDECKKYYITRLNQKNNELEKYKASKDNEINKERSDLEKFKRSLQMQLQDLQFDLEKQRNELKTEFDEVMRKREHEWRLQAEEFSSTLLAKDLEIKMLKNELGQAREDLNCLKSSTNEDENERRNLERKLKEKEWQLKDSVALKDAKIKDLESKLAHLQTSQKAVIDDLNRKNDELDRNVHEKQNSIENLKTCLSESEAVKVAYERELADLRQKLNDLTSLNSKDADQKVKVLGDELERVRAEYRKQVEVNSRQSVKSEMSHDEVVRKLEEAERLRRKLEASQERVGKLENELVRVSLEWQERYKYLEDLKVQDSDLWNKQLLESKNQALEQVKSLEEKLKHKENVIQALQTNEPLLEDLVESNEFKLKEENDRLKSIIKEMREEMENLATNPSTQSQILDLIPTKQVNRTKENGNLNIPPKVLVETPSKEFEDDLKRQLQEAKQKNRQLQAQIDEYMLKQKLIPENMSDNTIINSHIKTINETINILRKEKVDLTALCKKQQTKLLHMEKLMSEQNEQNRLKQTQIETLKYEMNSQTRRVTHEINSLKQTVANLELELSGTRREADEYHKATIEKGSELLALETKVSELKLKLSSSGTQINFGAQELFIQQLKDEIERLSGVNQQLQLKARQMHNELLRREEKEEEDSVAKNNKATTTLVSKNSKPLFKYKSESGGDETEWSSSSDFSKENETLKVKLKTAAKYINHLIQEKEHLIEMSNKLRGELNRIKYDSDNLTMARLNRDTEQQIFSLNRPASYSPQPQNSSPRSSLANKLQQLEKKQYELTKQQLAFAQIKNRTKSEPNLSKVVPPSNTKIPKPKVMVESSSEEATSNTVSSSVKSENLREIWKILEAEVKPVDQIESGLKITGFRPKSAASPSRNQNLAQKSPKTTNNNNNTNNKPNQMRNKSPKIRNYNVKD